MGKIRIIAGKYRRRQLIVLDSAGLRPTSDRVKETLFNWLGQDLSGLDCLDLFAGSGALAFEALSRNANLVVMVEKDQLIAAQLVENVKFLQIANAEVLHQDAVKFLLSSPRKFDVIFLDPPYASSLLLDVLALISGHLAPGGVVYLEATTLPEVAGLQLVKQSKAGKVQYALFNQE